MVKAVFFLDEFSNEDKIIDEIKTCKEKIVFPLSLNALRILEKNQIKIRYQLRQ